MPFQKGYIPHNKGKKGLFKHSNITKQKLSKLHVGMKYPFKERPKAKGRKVWNKGTKGLQISPYKGKSRPENCGENHPNWKGGISYLPYSLDWTRNLRIAIRERDKYTCQVCGEKQGDEAFCVHHIDYNKLNCNSDNLVTLCYSCHSKTNFNREAWIIKFKV
jgi:hypothetical protein